MWLLMLLTILAMAAAMDLTSWRIKNHLIAVGLILGFICRVELGNVQAILTYLVSIMLPVILLYLLFLMRALGAGDIKLLSVTGAFLGIRGGLYCILYSFVIGAVLSAGKIICQGSLWIRLDYLRSYISSSISTHTISCYDRYSGGRDDVIHFSICILLAVVIYLEVNY